VSQPNGQPRKTNRKQPGDGPVPGPPPGRPVAQGQFQPPPGARQSGFAPQPVPPSMEGVLAEFEALNQANQAKFAELAAQGIAPDPLYMVHARINHLIDAIAQATGPNGPRWAAMTRLGFEKYIAGELEQAGPATRRMQLAEGARYTPEMIRALAAQAGTLRRRTQ
jgi:hypothetical protein